MRESGTAARRLHRPRVLTTFSSDGAEPSGVHSRSPPLCVASSGASRGATALARTASVP